MTRSRRPLPARQQPHIDDKACREKPHRGHHQRRHLCHANADGLERRSPDEVDDGEGQQSHSPLEARICVQYALLPRRSENHVWISDERAQLKVAEKLNRPVGRPLAQNPD